MTSWRRLTWALLGLSLIVRLATFRDYGVTWDEQLERRNGLVTVRWYASGLSFLDTPEGSNQHLYGSFFNVLAWAASHVSPLGYYETSHLLVGAAGRFETDYWGASYKEAAQRLLARYHPGRRVRVANVSSPFFTEHHLAPAPDRFEPVRLPAGADVVLAITRWNGHERWSGTVLHVVEREGVPLCYVIERAASHRRPR